eukprot:Gregarina_sp_Poly_1__5973@NODE_3146_length_1338_cov_29_968529_g1317_i1_p1_GENE_NODE_3146_length_1338_cov_29_968529_g1317_i1NODE_3146_length_1338_cov_29_968529_g1317_i1_p1_ORF_typecomplete_len180_score22_31_NODE_3146_length_1338_cov_29_968529_g1317_i1228767
MRGILANTHRGSASLKTVATAAVSAICKLEQPPVSHIETSADIDISDDNEMKSIQSVNQNSDSNEVESICGDHEKEEEFEHLLYENAAEPFKITLHTTAGKRFLKLDGQNGIFWLDMQSTDIAVSCGILVGAVFAFQFMLILAALSLATKLLWKLIHRTGPFFLLLLLLTSLGHLIMLI